MTSHDRRRWEDDGGPSEPTADEVAFARGVLTGEVPPARKTAGKVRLLTKCWLTTAERDRYIREATERDYPLSNAPFFTRAEAVIERIRYKDWWFECGPQGDAYRIRVAFPAIDRTTGDTSVHRGRHWLLTPDMTDGDIVRTALLAVLTAEEHESREAFTIDGKPLFGPHFAIPS